MTERTGHGGRGLARRRRWTVNLLAALAIVAARAAPGRCSSSGSDVLRRISRQRARRTTPTSSSTSNTARSARSRAAACPTAIWKVLPALYPEEFEGRDDIRLRLPLRDRRRTAGSATCRSAFRRAQGARRRCGLVELRRPAIPGPGAPMPASPRRSSPAMPSNNLDFGRFVRMVFRLADRPAAGARPPVPGDGGAGHGARRARQAGLADRRPARAFAKACCSRAPACCRCWRCSRPGDRAGSTPSIPTR